MKCQRISTAVKKTVSNMDAVKKQFANNFDRIHDKSEIERLLKKSEKLS
jgi:hypothetical protein